MPSGVSNPSYLFKGPRPECHRRVSGPAAPTASSPQPFAGRHSLHRSLHKSAADSAEPGKRYAPTARSAQKVVSNLERVWHVVHSRRRTPLVSAVSHCTLRPPRSMNSMTSAHAVQGGRRTRPAADTHEGEPEWSARRARRPEQRLLQALRRRGAT